MHVPCGTIQGVDATTPMTHRRERE